MRETAELRSIARNSKRPTDFTRGIFQAIGYKEFDKYLVHIESAPTMACSSLRPDSKDEMGTRLFNQAVEEMKIATRQFAKSQVAWVRNQLRPAIVNNKSKNQVYFVSLDATGE